MLQNHTKVGKVNFVGVFKPVNSIGARLYSKGIHILTVGNGFSVCVH